MLLENNIDSLKDNIILNLGWILLKTKRLETLETRVRIKKDINKNKEGLHFASIYTI